MRNFIFPIAFSVAASAGAAPPQRVEIGYEIARNGSVVAEVIERLEHDGKTYRLTETWRGRGFYALRGEAVRSSRGAVAADGLRPQAFEDKRSGKDPLHAEFDPLSRTPTLLRQDRLSFLWTFAFAPPREAVTISVADGKRSTSYVYQAAGRERIRTPAGEFDTLKLAKRRDNPQDRATEIWFAMERGNLPVKLVYVDKDGTRIEQVAVRIASP
jgi:hypothetical protein